jgi:hypothetical protein
MTELVENPVPIVFPEAQESTGDVILFLSNYKSSY